MRTSETFDTFGIKLLRNEVLKCSFSVCLRVLLSQRENCTYSLYVFFVSQMKKNKIKVLLVEYLTTLFGALTEAVAYGQEDEEVSPLKSFLYSLGVELLNILQSSFNQKLICFILFKISVKILNVSFFSLLMLRRRRHQNALAQPICEVARVGVSFLRLSCVFSRVHQKKR